MAFVVRQRILQKPIVVDSGFVTMNTLMCYFRMLGIAAFATIGGLHCVLTITLRGIQEIGKLVQPVRMILKQRFTFIMVNTFAN